MRKFSKKTCALFLSGSLLFVTNADARIWQTTKNGLANDYLFIYDNRGLESVEVMWLAPAILDDTPETKTAREILDRFVIIGVNHAHLHNDGSVPDFEAMKALDVHSADGHSLKPLDPTNTPPAVVKALESLKVYIAEHSVVSVKEHIGLLSRPARFMSVQKVVST